MKHSFMYQNQMYDYTLYDHGSRYAIVFIPDWEGCHTPYAHRKAQFLANKLNARVLLTDIYGSGNQPTDYNQQTHAFIETTLSDPISLRHKLVGLLSIYLEIINLPETKLSFVGTCFGGSIALEAGRANTKEIDAVVSIHGTPASFDELRHAVPSRFMLIQGSHDPHIPFDLVNQFISEMNRSKNSWQTLILGNIQHSFTKEEVGIGAWGSFFDQGANDQSFDATVSFIRAKSRK